MAFFNRLFLVPKPHNIGSQADLLEAMKSLREEMQSMKKASEAEVDKTSASTSKAGLSKQSVELSDPIIQPNPWTSDHSDLDF